MVSGPELPAEWAALRAEMDKQLPEIRTEWVNLAKQDWIDTASLEDPFESELPVVGETRFPDSFKRLRKFLLPGVNFSRLAGFLQLNREISSHYLSPVAVFVTSSPWGLPALGNPLQVGFLPPPCARGIAPLLIEPIQRIDVALSIWIDPKPKFKDRSSVKVQGRARPR